MTRYELVATSLEPLDPEGNRGKWLVSLRNMGGCLEVYSGQYLAPGYLDEKLRIRTGRLQDGDLEVLCNGIMELIA